MLGTGISQNGLGAEAGSPLGFWPSISFLPTTLTCFFNGASDPPPDRRKKCVQSIHWLSKAYFISLLTRLQGCGWHGAMVAEAFKHTAGRPSSIKTNQWSIQPSSRPCCDEKGGREKRGRGRERKRQRQRKYLSVCGYLPPVIPSLFLPRATKYRGKGGCYRTQDGIK